MKISQITSFKLASNFFKTQKQTQNSNTQNQQNEQNFLNFYPISNISFLAKQKDFSAKAFLDELKFENSVKKYYFTQEQDGKTTRFERILPNKEALEKLKILDSLTPAQQQELVREFCAMTGFPDMKKITQNIEKEISSSIHKLAQEKGFEVAFIGYDSNCSIGRKLSMPGSDCDGLYMIIDAKEHKEPWFAGSVRWNFKDLVNQRILHTPADHLPEVLDIDFIKEGLNIAQKAFQDCNFTQEELKKFSQNLYDSSNDFVKSAEFNIRLAQKIPNDEQTREKYYKTAMLVEILRNGVICEDNLDMDLYFELMNSPLFEYSNLMKQKGLSHSLKGKYIARQSLEADFKKMSAEEQFELVKDILHYSFNDIQENKNKKYFSNFNQNQNEMGNINEMYGLVLNTAYIA
ncbi:MAG: hypothetical protein IJB79_08890 [Candidatus Gastranaerophilales bacterium]|nr:hypothetical protein [Candidatus Gastranaerophilales bacterium]